MGIHGVPYHGTNSEYSSSDDLEYILKYFPVESFFLSDLSTWVESETFDFDSKVVVKISIFKILNVRQINNIFT